MDIVILGAGNVAGIFGKLLFQKKHKILQIVGKTPEHAASLAMQLQASFTTDINEMDTGAHLYLFALPDNLIQEVAAYPLFQHKFLVHASGSVPAEVFKNFTETYGVLWPIQSLNAQMGKMTGFPLVITASNAYTLNSLIKLGNDLTTGEVVVLTDEEKGKLHLAAVFASNFTNYLYQMAFSYCNEQNLPFSLLIPLIHQTAARMNDTTAPIALQTGPAFRNDSVTIQHHQSLLTHKPKYAQLYKFFTDYIIEEKIKNKSLNSIP
ncbi:Rossmann-like and DUF2520 domain-containing protein [Hydrotalea sp.]|uniref:Rossmann-like and DUF2520 domain-containing protein n=1 Tax=Hydrotalea sp. TaxID=2881279 RepID=UPI002621FBF2|nr:DUF2520 domain-containing protein [Hydrotalea sp.]